MHIHSYTAYISRSVVFSVAILLTLGACDTARHPTARKKEATRTMSPGMTSASDVQPSARLPLNKYALTTSAVSIIAQAQDKLTRTCMQRFSLTYSSPPQHAQKTGEDRRYGVADPQLAAQYGYHSLPDESMPKVTLSDLQFSALTGSSRKGKKVRTLHGTAIPAGGCTGYAWQQARGRFTSGELSNTANSIDVSSFKKSLKNTVVAAAFRKWSECMKGNGYSYGTPLDSIGDARFDTPTPTPVEISTARADVSCKQKTGLLTHWITVESGIQNRMIKAHLGEFTELKAQHQKELEYARSVIG
jgi:hypothetical protein